MVRNFWVDADIDGRQTMLSGGPRRKDGGMRLEIYQRDDGCIAHSYTIDCFVDRDGLLRCTVENRITNEIVSENTTER